MKKLTKISFIFLIGLVPLSCTDLEEEILDEALNKDLLTGEGFEDGVLASVYGGGDVFYTAYWNGWGLQELSTDEALIPTRITDWDDNGVYRELHQFTWTPSHSNITGSWNELTKGIANSLQAISGLQNSTSASRNQFIAEARAVGAVYMLSMLDLFGVVLTRDTDNLDFRVAPQVLKGTEAIDFIITAFEESLPSLPGRIGNENLSRGRMTQEAARGFLSRAYLNRAVYLDPYAGSFNFSNSDMQAVIDNTTAVINSGAHDFERDDYFAMFDLDNANNPEHIYVIDQRFGGSKNGTNWIGVFALSRGHRVAPGRRPFNGGCTTPEFLATWTGNTDDPRYSKVIYSQDGTVTALPSPDFAAGEIFDYNRGFLEGQQYGPFLNDAGSDFTRVDGDPSMLVIGELRNFRNDNLVIHNRDLDNIFTTQEAGVRVHKYEIQPESCCSGSVDIPLLRFAGMYLMRAESKLRNGDAGGALDDVNTVRTARGASLLTSLDLEAMYNERGYELYWEQVRRTDMIRYGTYDNPRLFKAATSPERRLYPIPQSAIDVNPNIRQNEGY